MSDVAPQISVVIPAKDEAKRLPAFLKELISYCQQSKKIYEIIVVDDGSSDQTTEAALKFQEKFPSLSVMRFEKNQGKGHAIQQGFLEAQGEIVLFMDADGSTPPKEIEDNLAFFDEGADIVIGSRVLCDKQHHVEAKNYRRFIGKVFNALVHLFLIRDIQDTQCGFKMFRQKTIQPIFSRMHIRQFGFDLEALYLAKRLNYKIKEVPVNWHHVDESKTDLIKDSLKMLINIFQIKFWHQDMTTDEGSKKSTFETPSIYRVDQNSESTQSGPRSRIS